MCSSDLFIGTHTEVENPYNKGEVVFPSEEAQKSRKRVQQQACTPRHKNQACFSTKRVAVISSTKTEEEDSSYSSVFWHGFRERLLYKICTVRTAKYSCSDTLPEVAVQHLMLT